MVLTSLSLPSAELEYLAQLATRVQASLGDSLIALYLFGSAALGRPIYESGISDLDVQAVIQRPLLVARYTSLASDISHSSLPCPATKLEFVVYTRAEAQAAAARSPQYELNLNTGVSQKEDRLSLDWRADAQHWFLLDVAAGREGAVPLFGPPAVEVFGEPSRGIVLEALKESLEWHADQERGPNGVANAARAWRWVREGVWGSKMEGVEWGITRDAERRWRGLLSAVSLARSGRVELDATNVRSFLQMVMCEVEDAIELQKG